MSRAYRIRVSESVTRTVHISDGLEFKLELLDILSKERMQALLTAALEQDGFKPNAAGLWVREDTGGIETQVDPNDGAVQVRLGLDEELSGDRSLEGRVEEEQAERGRQRLQQRAKRLIDEELSEKEAEIRKQVTEKIERRLGDIRAGLDRVSNRVVAEALKERAAQLGEIQEMSEDPESGSLTIRVRV